MSDGEYVDRPRKRRKKKSGRFDASRFVDMAAQSDDDDEVESVRSFSSRRPREEDSMRGGEAGLRRHAQQTMRREQQRAERMRRLEEQRRRLEGDDSHEAMVSQAQALVAKYSNRRQRPGMPGRAPMSPPQRVPPKKAARPRPTPEKPRQERDAPPSSDQEDDVPPPPIEEEEPPMEDVVGEAPIDTYAAPPMEEYEDDGMDDMQANQNMLPSVRDSKLYSIGCKPGNERDAVAEILRKYMLRKGSGKEYYINAAFTPDVAKGYIYVECDKPIHVREMAFAVRQYVFPWKITLVPINEMVEAITTAPPQKSVKKGQWVRMKGGLFKGDIALVIGLDDNGTKLRIKLVPRLKLEPPKDGERARGFGFNKDGSRPPQRFFDAEEVRNFLEQHEAHARGDLFHSQGEYTFRNQRYRGGYLIRVVNLNAVIPDAQVTADEISRFRTKREAGESDAYDVPLPPPTSASSASLKEQQELFRSDDTVRVVKGDLINMTGKVVNVKAGKIYVIPNHEDIIDTLAFPPDELRKYFTVGNHVKVIRKPHDGETGLITQVKDNDETLVIFTDSTHKEITVLARDVIETTEISSGRDSLGNFVIHDFVQLDKQSVGVIVKIENEAFQVLDQHNNERKVRLQDISKRNNPRSVNALDRFANQISQNDIVRVTGASYPPEGVEGTVKYIYNSALFLQCRTRQEHAGILVVRAKEVQVTGAGRRRPGAKGLSKYSSGITVRTRGERNPRPTAPPRRGRRDPWEGKSIRITRGVYKGYRGIVKQVPDANLFRIELHTEAKIVTVNRSDVQEDRRDDQRGARRAPDRDRGDRTPHIGDRTPHIGGGGRTPGIGTKTPRLGGRTPGIGSRTPGYGGGRTPGYGGSRTPAARTPGYGAQTPAYGSKTPAYGSKTPAYGSKTPAYGAQTPAYGNQTPALGSATPNLGAATPAYGGGGQTPGNNVWNIGADDQDDDEEHEAAVPVWQQTQKNEPGPGGRTPALDGARTPAHGDRTPALGNRTPAGHGGAPPPPPPPAGYQTPVHPHHSQPYPTPQPHHSLPYPAQAPPPRTPVHHLSQPYLAPRSQQYPSTPSHQTYDSLDPHAPGFNSETPGRERSAVSAPPSQPYPGSQTPSHGVSTPAYSQNQHDHTQSFAAPMEISSQAINWDQTQMSQEDSFVDNNYGANTPGYGGRATPGANTPGYGGQATPGYSQAMSQGNAAAGASSEGIKKKFGREWLVPEVLCRRRHDGEEGVIRSRPHPDGMVSVQFGAHAVPLSIHIGEIEPVVNLQKDDRVYVLLPPEMRGFGSLLDLQENGLIVELEVNSNIEMPAISDIVKAHKP